MASRPDWLVETEDNEDNNEQDMYPQNTPSWLTPIQPKQLGGKKSNIDEKTPLRSTKTERKRRKKYKQSGGNDRLRLLEYKATRPCCLSCFGILHVTTIVAAILAIVSQFLDLAAVYQNNSVDIRGKMTFTEIFDVFQVFALHTYGMIFACSIILIESSEFEFSSQWLKSCHDNILTEKWMIRGLLYNFIGLFALQSGREYVSIILNQDEDNQDDDNENDLIANFNKNKKGNNNQQNNNNNQDNEFLFDDPNALALIRYSGAILMVVGFIYFVLGASCCKSLKEYQLKEMKKSKEELFEFMETLTEDEKNIKRERNNGDNGGDEGLLLEDGLTNQDIELTNKDIFGGRSDDNNTRNHLIGQQRSNHRSHHPSTTSSSNNKSSDSNNSGLPHWALPEGSSPNTEGMGSYGTHNYHNNFLPNQQLGSSPPPYVRDRQPTSTSISTSNQPIHSYQQNNHNVFVDHHNNYEEEYRNEHEDGRGSGEFHEAEEEEEYYHDRNNTYNQTHDCNTHLENHQNDDDDQNDTEKILYLLKAASRRNSNEEHENSDHHKRPSWSM